MPGVRELPGIVERAYRYGMKNCRPFLGGMSDVGFGWHQAKRFPVALALPTEGDPEAVTVDLNPRVLVQLGFYAASCGELSTHLSTSSRLMNTRPSRAFFQIFPWGHAPFFTLCRMASSELPLSSAARLMTTQRGTLMLPSSWA